MPYWVRTALKLLPEYDTSIKLVARKVLRAATIHHEKIDGTGLIVLLRNAPDTINDRLIAMQTELGLGVNGLVSESEDEGIVPPSAYRGARRSQAVPFGQALRDPALREQALRDRDRGIPLRQAAAALPSPEPCPWAAGLSRVVIVRDIG